ncbi:MAG TPA: aspartate aminotransferase family protein [Thermoplasmata archaeon]
MGLLERELSAFRRRTRRSARLFENARRYTPFGVHSNYRLVEPYPLYVRRARGTSIWDADGHRYLDFNMAFGSLVAGHANPIVVRAVREQAADGMIFGFESTGTARLAKVLCDRFRMERVKLSNTGMDATQFAVRFARAFTGRSTVLKFEGCYHGSHDALLVSVKPTREREGDARRPTPVPASKGLVPELVRRTAIAPFNDLPATEAIARERADDLAAIILEPVPMNMGFVLPAPGFLEGLRRLASELGALLIFDEVKTGVKWYGGAEEVFGVTPDLKVFGKGLAGGLPVAAVGGRADVMDAVVPGVVSHAGTYNSNPLGVAAAVATLTKVLTRPRMEAAARLGGSLLKGYADIVEDRGVPVRVQGMGISGTVHFTETPVMDWRSFQSVDVAKWWGYYTAMLNRGVIPMATGPDEQWTVSVLHTRPQVERHLEVFDAVASEIARFEAPMEMVESL